VVAGFTAEKYDDDCDAWECCRDGIEVGLTLVYGGFAEAYAGDAELGWCKEAR
jgi:hypothetical protein